jgi:hypothetical protein
MIIVNHNGNVTVTFSAREVSSLAWDLREIVEGSGLFEDAPEAPLVELSAALGVNRAIQSRKDAGLP